MQTLKTAAIVVLMMTVMYGAYVSLTTPPEPLPADVEAMLEFSEGETFSVESGLPASLGELGINDGDSIAPPLSAQQEGGTPSLGVATYEGLPNVPSGYAANDPRAATPPPPVDTEFSTEGSTGVSTSISDVAAVPSDLPELPESKPNYPTTGSTFELPDPNSLPTNLPSPGTSASSSAAQDLALTGGTSDTPGGMTPAAAVIPSTDVPPPGSSRNIGLDNAIRTADDQYFGDQRRAALATLSIFYNTPNLSGEQRSELLTRLDPLAREVIYSKRHLLEQPHRVGQNETLMDVAASYKVPWQLLANINQIKDPVTILPGTELKVVRGPFRAEVNLATKELTLFLGDLYAGRFPIEVGDDPTPREGQYMVQEKQTSRTFYNRAGSPVPPGSPQNPYGNAWIDLGKQVCIHGSPSTTSATDKGCISLAADYADDLYGILSQGSSVTIRR